MSTAAHILIVDDDESLLRLLELRLTARHYRVTTATSAQEALAAFRRQPADLVLTDLRMDDMDGIGLLEALHELDSMLPVVIMTAHGSIAEAVTATQKGVVAFLTKPLDNQTLESVIERHITVLAGEGLSTGPVITRNEKMRSLLETARRIAPGDVNVLITGESGTGKEVLARYLHEQSRRSGAEFVPVNCGALPEGLMEAELFGYVKGAFTGATRARDGLFRQATGGTLFLDEIGEMPLSLQVKLLRALQEKKVRPVGSDLPVDADARIISATHVDLEQAVRDKHFREDLFYRINVVQLHLPPLRERREDIPLLAQHFLTQAINQGIARHATSLSKDALKRLCAFDWPGNIRQLQNVIQRLIALSPAPVISEKLVIDALGQLPDAPLPTLAEVRDEAERRYLEKVLTLTSGQVSDAARIAGRNRTDFYKLLKRHGLDPAQFKP